MIYNLSFFSDIGFSIKQALRTFSCKIATILYDWIIDLYNVFMYTARAEILSNEFIQKIYNKVGMILGIFMVFKLAFSLIQALVDPSKLTDGKNGFASIIKRSVIAIVLLGITPSLFRTAFQFQNLIAGAENNTDNLIYKLIVGDAPSHSADSFGRIIASKLYFGFYKENEPYKLDNGIEIEYPDSGGSTVKVDNYENLVDNVTNGTKQFSDTIDYLSITSSGHYVIDWNGLFAIGMAIAMIWILVTYCIQVATRVIQLAYLQLVAPVPILSYISDPEGAFKNWTKQCLTTYLDLFIRLAIIYFIITVSTQILEAWDDTESILYQSTTISPQDTSTMFWVVIFLIIGLLMFGKRVPELLKDLFPNFGGGAASLGFGIKSPKNTLADIPLLGGATNKVLGYAGNGAKKLGGWTWKKTGGKGVNAIKEKYKTRKDDRNAYKEQMKLDNESDKVWKEYGEAFDGKNYKKAFQSSKDKTGEYAESYNKLEEAKAALKEFQGDTNSAEYRKLLADKENAEKNHNVNKEKYKELARREEQLKRYKNRHPNQNNGGGLNGNNDNNNQRPNPQTSPTTSANGNSAPSQNNQSSMTQSSQSSQSQIPPGRPEQYDEKIEYATNKYNELVDNGASDDELQQQLETLKNLNDGKEQAEKYYREIDNHIDEANERNNDGYGGQ